MEGNSSKVTLSGTNPSLKSGQLSRGLTRVQKTSEVILPQSNNTEEVKAVQA